MPHAFVATTLKWYVPAGTTPFSAFSVVGMLPTYAPVTFSRKVVGAGPLAELSQFRNNVSPTWYATKFVTVCGGPLHALGNVDMGEGVYHPLTIGW